MKLEHNLFDITLSLALFANIFEKSIIGQISGYFSPKAETKKSRI